LKKISDIDPAVLAAVRKGIVIPAMPLALDANRKYSPRYQRALCRYYVDAGAGGLAIGVHSTQFEIRDPDIGLFETVLAEASGFVDSQAKKSGKPFFRIAGACGKTDQAVREAAFAGENGYDACLLSMAAFKDASVDEMIAHCREIAGVMPIFGFYLQPKTGGRLLPYEFWREFAEIENVLGIKMAPFNRYQTLDVVRGVIEAGREDEIVLYTGNDDNIVVDLLTEYRMTIDGEERCVRIVGGLLGHWAVWTQKVVEMLDQIHEIVTPGAPIPQHFLSLNVEVTDCNAVLFDAANEFNGCLPGIHEVLYRQGLIEFTGCLDSKQALSPGQAEEIDRLYRLYPHLADDDFVAANLERWLAD
jgi:dihydrodipicolinate synthase/N-acetylneuraminate lyase